MKGQRERILCYMRVGQRTFTLTLTPVLNRAQWYEGRTFVITATAMECALGCELSRLQRRIVRLECEAGLAQDCFTCENESCEGFWGIRTKLDKENGNMPSKARIKAAEKRGTNPYAVANAMKKKHGWSAAKTERAVYDITANVLGQNVGKSAHKAKAKSKGSCKKGR